MTNEDHLYSNLYIEMSGALMEVTDIILQCKHKFV